MGAFETFMNSSAAGPVIGTGLDLIFGDEPSTPRPGQQKLASLPALLGQMYAKSGQGAFPLLAGQYEAGVPQFNMDDFRSQTQDIYGMMEELMADDRGRAREDMQSRLYAQGRLGSTGGALEQEALESAIEEQRTRNMLSAMDTARGYQDTSFNQWLASTQALSGQGRGLFSGLAPYDRYFNYNAINAANPYDWTDPSVYQLGTSTGIMPQGFGEYPADPGDWQKGPPEGMFSPQVLQDAGINANPYARGTGNWIRWNEENG